MIKRKGLLSVILTIFLTSLLCIVLYQTDNKYTRQDTQPISGLLFYKDSSDVCYLTRQWIIYPAALLTPESISNYSGYRYYGDIGEQNSSSDHSMTYQLTLLLPESEKEYALELPEIFSSYHLYVNDKLLYQSGNPFPESYDEKIANHLLTFSASGETRLLLAVSDYSGVQFGLTYPPAFGSLDAVLAKRDGRILVHSAFLLLSGLCTLLAISVGLHKEKYRNILTCLLNFAQTLVIGYPLYHTYFTTSVQPWYTLEPLCYYTVLLLALLLQTEIYKIKRKTEILLTVPCIFGLAATFVRFGFAAILPDSAAVIFSWISTGLKYYTALCLLILSILALWQKKTHSTILLCGSAGFATCLIWDRILPLYEPIYGGWFAEIGSVLLTASLTITLWLDVLDAYRFRLTFEESYTQMEQRLALQREHYGQLSKQVLLARTADHDLRHHMRTIQGLIEHQQWQRLNKYLGEYNLHLKERELTIWSDHPVADAVLAHYALMAREQNTAYDVRLVISPNLNFPDDELCILLSNLLENAINAVSKQPAGVRKIYLRGDVSDNRLGIIMDNTFSEDLIEKDGVFLSTKHSGHGLGLISVRAIAEKYGGLADFSAEDHIFHTSVLIPLPRSISDKQK